MRTFTTGRQYLTRTAILTTIVAAFVLAAPQGAGANRASEAAAKGDTFAAMCRAAGGTPTWTTSIDSTGTATYIVECDGGYLDGLNCFFDEGFTDCTATRFDRSGSAPTVEPAGVAPLDEPVVDPVGSVDEPDGVAPPVDEPEPTATPAPEEEPVTQQPVDDGAGGEDDLTIGDGVDEPAATDDPALPETDPADGQVVGEVSDGAADEETVQLT
jgi:hypothetical protein